MKLTDCEPRFARYDGNREIEGDLTVANAQGICFNEPTKGVRICIPFRNRGVPSHINGGQQWEVVSGSGFDDLTLTPSIDASRYGLWHGHITNGVLT